MANLTPGGSQPPNRPAEHLSATDEDRPNEALQAERSSGPKAPFDVFTPQGWKPFFPPEPEAPQSSELPEADNPFNPKGQPSQSLPQQATPLTSDQGALTLEDMADPVRSMNIAMTQDGLAPDDPRNPRGTPDYIVGEVEEDRPSHQPVPPPASDKERPQHG